MLGLSNFKFIQGLQREFTKETVKLRLDSVEQETNFHDFNLLLIYIISKY